MTNILRPEGRTKDGGTAERGIYRLLLRGDVLADCISVYFLAAGLCLALLPMTVLYGGVGETLRAAGVCVLALAIMRIRWWIGPSLAALTLGGFAFHLHRTEQLAGHLAYWGAFLSAWISDGAVGFEIPSGSFVFLLLQYLIIFSTAFALFLVLRRLFSIWIPLVALGVSMLVADVFPNADIDLILPMALYAVGLVILLPRIYSRYIKTARRSAMQMIAVPGAVLVVLLGLQIAPESGTNVQWRPLTRLFLDVGYLVDSPFYTHYESSGNFGLGSFGYEPVPDRLGGPAVLPDWHMLTVKAGRPILLRGTVMDTYTGTSWRNSVQDGDFRYESPFFRRQRTDAFGFDMPLGGSEARRLYESITTEVSLEITYMAAYYTTVFTGSGMTGLSFSNPALLQDAFFNRRSELYLTYSVPSGETVFITARVPDTNRAGFDESFVRLESLVADDSGYDEIHARYTALPENFPEGVREKALEIVSGVQSPYLKATAIARWLGENHRYTLDPTVPPRDSDFVEYFLETGEGYCTYYASAMAVMSRSAGLPARYVTGFALERDSALENTFYATGFTAHAWVEVYFSGIGWMPIDPLRWNADAPLNLGRQQGDLSAVEAVPYEEEEEYLDDWGWVAVTPAPARAQPVDFRPYATGALIALILGFIVYLCIGWNSKYRKYASPRVMRKFPDITARFGYYYADIMQQLSLLGVKTLPGETLRHYPVRVDKRIEVENSSFHTIAEAQMRLHFARITPSAADVEIAGEFHATLEDMLRETLSPPAYMWRRIIVKR